MDILNYETLAKVIGGSAIGFRSVTRLEPLGGPGDKLFPPTFGGSVPLPSSIDGSERSERRLDQVCRRMASR